MFIAESVSDSAGDYAGALSGFDVGVTVTDHQRIGRGNLKLFQHRVQQRRMGLFFGTAIAPQNRIEALFHTQTAQHRDCEAMQLVRHNNVAFIGEMVEHVFNVRVENSFVEQVLFIMF